VQHNLLEGLGIDAETLFLLSTAPQAWYDRNLDAFSYLARECSWRLTSSAKPRISLLTDGMNTVGFRVPEFFSLSREERDAFIEATGLDLDDIRGIEAVWIRNVEEMLPEIERSETEFFEELRRRIAMGLIKN